MQCYGTLPLLARVSLFATLGVSNVDICTIYAHNVDSPLREVASLDGVVQLPGSIVGVFASQPGRLGGGEGL